MTRLFHSYHRYDESRIGKEYWVLICERASDGKSYVGHNKCYGLFEIFFEIFRNFLVRISNPDPYEAEILKNENSSKNGLLLGKWAHVRIVGVSKFYMRSEILNWKGSKDENILKENSLKLENGWLLGSSLIFWIFICLIFFSNK